MFTSCETVESSACYAECVARAEFQRSLFYWLWHFIAAIQQVSKTAKRQTLRSAPTQIPENLKRSLALHLHSWFCLRQHPIQGCRQHIQTTLARRKTSQLAFAIEQVISRHVTLIVLKGIT